MKDRLGRALPPSNIGKTTIQTARQAAKAAGVRLYSKAGLTLALGLLRRGAEGARATPLPPRPMTVVKSRPGRSLADHFARHGKSDG